MKRTSKNKEYEVERIVDFDGKYYTIKWKGYKKTTKEPIKNLGNCLEMVQEFHRRIESEERERSKSGIKYFGFNYGKGLVIMEGKNTEIGRTFNEALTVDSKACATYLEEMLLKKLN